MIVKERNSILNKVHMWQSLGPWLHFFAFLWGWPCEQSKFMINDIITFWDCISSPFLIVYIKALKASQLGKLGSSLDRAEEESQGQEQAQLQKTCRGRQQNTYWASWQLYICLLLEPATLQSSWCEGTQRQSLLLAPIGAQGVTLSVCPSVRLSVCLSVRHKVLYSTHSSSYHQSD